MNDLKAYVADLNKRKDPQKALLLAGYFKTGKGQYGEGDVFLGITLPVQRQIAKQYQHLSLADIADLLKSKIHEHRLGALLILVAQYQKSNAAGKKKIADFYLLHTKCINNWDLVDLSADKILGDYLIERDKKILYVLARSKNLWEKRIAVLSTFAFIREGMFEDTFRIAEILLPDTHDLIHKAVGWALREVGKKDQAAEEKFLKKHLKKLPRTTLRYAIERFDEKKRQAYLAGTI